MNSAIEFFLRDYDETCKRENRTPARIIFTFAPFGRQVRSLLFCTVLLRLGRRPIEHSLRILAGLFCLVSGNKAFSNRARSINVLCIYSICLGDGGFLMLAWC